MPVTLRSAYDLEVRPVPPAARPDLVLETDGPVRRSLSRRGGMITHPSLTGMTGPDLDRLITRQRDHFAGLGRPFDWVTYTHDEPADLPERLLAAGLVRSEAGTILAGRSAGLADSGVEPAGSGAVIRAVTTEADFRRIAELQSKAWGIDASWLVPQLTGQQAGEPGDWTFLVAEDDGRVVSAGWTRYLPGRFAMLYGGATLPQWQGRGIYRALVTRRAREAQARGREWVAVDASGDSRPILERLGLTPVATRVTYRWLPPA